VEVEVDIYKFRCRSCDSQVKRKEKKEEDPFPPPRAHPRDEGH